MNPFIRNLLAVVAGMILGGVVNMGIIMISGSIIPPPPGVDVADMESLKANMHLFEFKHFIMPFLAHAIGTLVGAALTAKLAINNNLRLAMVVGCFFLLGGIMSVSMLPAPLWFNILDIVGAYIPMAWIGHKLVNG